MHIIYGNDLGNIKAKAIAGDALKMAMEESIKFAITNQYGNERAGVEWTKIGADAFDVILSKERGAAGAAAQAAAAAH